MKRQVIEVPVISEAIRRLGAPTSALVRAGNLLFTCGMPPVDIRTGDIVRGDIAVQARAALDALEATGYRGYLTFEYFHPYPHWPEALIHQTADSLDRMLGIKA